jgi:hypothetical protein
MYAQKLEMDNVFVRRDEDLVAQQITLAISLNASI